MVRLPVVRRRHVWIVAPFIALIAPLGRALSDNSFLWHVRAGTVQLGTGEVLRTDPFSFTAAGEPWRTQSWLAELGYGWLERTSGGVGWSMTLVLFCLLSSGLLVVLRASRRGVAVPVLFGVGLLFVLQTFSFAVPRPVVLSYPLLAAIAVLIDDDDAELWLAPAIIWLWASLHGSFPLGIGLLALDALRRRSVRRTAVTGVSVVVASLSAHGLAIWGILGDFLANRETLSFIEEWSRPSPTDLRALPFFAVVALLVVLTMMRRIGVRDLVVALPFAVFGLTAVRNMLPALVVVAPVVAAALTSASSSAPTAADDRDDVPIANAFLVASVIAALIVVAALPRSLSAERFPSTDLVVALDEGRVVHDDAVGGYLIWAAGPDRQVFIDDRAELYGPQAFETMRDVLAGDLDALAATGATQALVGRDEPLVARLEATGWVERASDARFVLLVAPR